MRVTKLCWKPGIRCIQTVLSCGTDKQNPSNFYNWILAACCNITPLYDKFHKVVLWRDTQQQICSKLTGNREMQSLGSCDRASWAKCVEREPTRCNNQMFIINFSLNMFRASLCPSSGEQRPCYCIWCTALVLLDVVGSAVHHMQ